MKFIRIGDEIIRLDLITHVKEGCREETLYGRSVRKTTDHRHGWLEVHFVSGEVIKVEGEGAHALRQVLEEECKARDSSPSNPSRKLTAHGGQAAEPASARLDHASHPAEEHRPILRNGLGR